MSEILVVDDEAVIRSSLKRLLVRHGYNVELADSVEQALELEPDRFDLIISDLRLPGADGTTLIGQTSGTPVLIMTSFASIRSAVDAVKAGAADYIAKPFDHDDMLLTIERILTTQSLAKQNASLLFERERSQPRHGIIGECEDILALHRKIARLAPLNTTVLILGESGTGKELVARALHEQSPRHTSTIISVNCAAIPDTLIESELFGHEKGAFTGAQTQRKGLVEAADGGTLFLDEIGELPLDAQARLLRFLQEKEIRRLGATHAKKVDIRLITATHRDLPQLVRQGKFREDLYFRLNVMELVLPPLRARGRDVVLIAHALLQRAIERVGTHPVNFSDEALQVMLNYSWPGNIRELENAIERAVILTESDTITASALAIQSGYSRADIEPKQASAITDDDHEPPTGTSLEDYFQHFVLEHQEHMSETALAQKLGISRKTLWERRQKLGIPRRK